MRPDLAKSTVKRRKTNYLNLEHDLRISTVSVPIHSSGQANRKFQNQLKHLTTKATEKEKLTEN